MQATDSIQATGGVGQAEWLPVPGPLTLFLRFGPEGDFVLAGRIKTSAEVLPALRQVRTLLENRAAFMAHKRHARSPKAGALSDADQYSLFGTNPLTEDRPGQSADTSPAQQPPLKGPAILRPAPVPERRAG